MRSETRNLSFEIAELGRAGDAKVLEVAWRKEANPISGRFPGGGICLMVKLYQQGEKDLDKKAVKARGEVWRSHRAQETETGRQDLPRGRGPVNGTYPGFCLGPSGRDGPGVDGQLQTCSRASKQLSIWLD